MSATAICNRWSMPMSHIGTAFIKYAHVLHGTAFIKYAHVLHGTAFLLQILLPCSKALLSFLLSELCEDRWNVSCETQSTSVQGRYCSAAVSFHVWHVSYAWHMLTCTIFANPSLGALIFLVQCIPMSVTFRKPMIFRNMALTKYYKNV